MSRKETHRHVSVNKISPDTIYKESSTTFEPEILNLERDALASIACSFSTTTARRIKTVIFKNSLIK